ncbi:hypothetical protein [Saccharibacillus kuerlensis]|uniref:Uncharacterized protein n=1 Tax=Saccharibacillus kuerlensis TaxID=459527 RepID=A0ABQ2KVN1_9BACL|nr:hypothetical protein [Saccharibacillus kuerlensis]GGN94113.1 hypothetical protein GCM10010969_08520 [Saccharibacillus kuerlensis]
MFAVAMTLLGLLSYAAGLAGYIYALDFFYGQTLGGDLNFVVFTTLVGFLVIACPLYIGIVYMVDKKIRKYKLLMYPAACILIFFVPTLIAHFFTLLLWGGISLFSSEAFLFHCFYVCSGLVFGIGYWCIQQMNWGSFYRENSGSA